MKSEKSVIFGEDKPAKDSKLPKPPIIRDREGEYDGRFRKKKPTKTRG